MKSFSCNFTPFLFYQNETTIHFIINYSHRILRNGIIMFQGGTAKLRM